MNWRRFRCYYCWNFFLFCDVSSFFFASVHEFLAELVSQWRLFFFGVFFFAPRWPGNTLTNPVQQRACKRTPAHFVRTVCIGAHRHSHTQAHTKTQTEKRTHAHTNRHTHTDAHTNTHRNTQARTTNKKKHAENILWLIKVSNISINNKSSNGLSLNVI